MTAMAVTTEGLLGPLISASMVLGLWFVVALGLPWRSADPSMAWLWVAMAAVTFVFDLALLLALMGFTVPIWVFAIVLAAQDAVFVWRLGVLRRARRDDKSESKGERS